MDRRLFLIYAIVFIDIAIGSVIWPIIPQLVEAEKHPELILSLGTAVFLGIQLFTAPLMGKLSDRYGRKPIFLLSSVGTLLANLFLLLRNTTGYFLNRGSDGMTNGVYSTVRASITDVSPTDKLTRNIGLEGTMVSLGFVAGPLLAGAVLIALGVDGKDSIVPLVILGLSLSLINIILCLLFRETHEARSNKPIQLARSLNPFTALCEFWALRHSNRKLFTLLSLNACVALTLGYYHYYVPFISFGKLQMTPKEISIFFTYFGLINVVINTVFYTKIAHRIRPRRFLSVMAILGILVLMSYTFIGSSKLALYTILTIDCLTISLIPGVMDSLIGKQTNSHNRGQIFGINQMLESFSSILTALIFGALTLVTLNLPFYWFALCLVPLVFICKLIPREEFPPSKSIQLSAKS